MNALPTTTSTTVPCTCGQFVFADGNDARTKLPCGGVTKRTFAPGHDARLKGALIRAGVAGHTVIWGDQRFEPTQVADKFGFGHMVRKGIQLAQDKELAKAIAKEAKATEKAKAKLIAEAKAEPTPEVAAPAEPEVAEVKPVKVRFKIGRNEFDGELQLDAKTVVYTNAAGETKEITRGYKIIDAG